MYCHGFKRKILDLLLHVRHYSRHCSGISAWTRQTWAPPSWSWPSRACSMTRFPTLLLWQGILPQMLTYDHPCAEQRKWAENCIVMGFSSVPSQHNPCPQSLHFCHISSLICPGCSFEAGFMEEIIKQEQSTPREFLPLLDLPEIASVASLCPTQAGGRLGFF